MLKNSETKFGSLHKLLHWSIGLLILANYGLIFYRNALPEKDPAKMPIVLLHKSIGATVLVLSALFLIWKLVNVRPKWPQMKLWERALARFTHLFLFIGMFSIPATGYLMSAYAGYPTGVFKLFNLPLLVGKNEHLSHFYHDTHIVIAYVLLGFITLHLLGALFHHFVRKDNVLKRMIF